jgi:hypothetical protein
MKKLLLLLLLIQSTIVLAQVPQGFNYQATVRNSSGGLIINQNVNFKFNVMQNTPTSVPVFSETHLAPSDDLGAVNLVIGKGTATKGVFSQISWGSGTYYLGIELNTGSGYVAMGTTQLLSVPYALYASSTQSKGKPSIMISGNITDAQAAAQIAAEFGPYTENIVINNTTGLTYIDLSMIVKLIELRISNNRNLTRINLKYLSEIYGDCVIQTNPNLSSIDLPSLTSIEFGFNLRSNALTSSFINSFLNKLLTVTPSTGKYVQLDHQNPPAPPTGQGLIDKETLNNSGNSVFTD